MVRHDGTIDPYSPGAPAQRRWSCHWGGGPPLGQAGAEYIKSIPSPPRKSLLVLLRFGPWAWPERLLYLAGKGLLFFFQGVYICLSRGGIFGDIPKALGWEGLRAPSLVFFKTVQQGGWLW
jgi:hypothetical protein